MALFDAFGGQKKWRRIALTDPKQPKRFEAVKKLEDQEALEMVAKSDENEYVRSNAIVKLSSADALLACVLRDNSKNNRETAVRRFCEVSSPEALIPGLLKLTNDRQKVGEAAALMDATSLEKALSGVEDAELVQMVKPKYAYGMLDVEKKRRERIIEICDARIKAIEKLEAQRKAATLSTDADRLAFALDKSSPLDPRVAIVQQIADEALLAKLAENEAAASAVRAAAVRQMKAPDDALLARILRSKSGRDALNAAAERIGDTELLAEIAEEMDDLDLWGVYPILMKRCARYTPEYVLFDRRAKSEVREQALRSVKDDGLLAKFVCSRNGDYGGTLSALAISRITDRQKLRWIASEEGRKLLCDNSSGQREHLAWCAAWRAGDAVLMNNIEQQGNHIFAGSHVLVYVPDDTYHWIRRCIRCDKVGSEDDMRKKPCRPDFPRL